MSESCAIWLTGLPASGKTTIAQALAKRLLAQGNSVETLDGDDIRLGLSADLGFSAEDRQQHTRRVHQRTDERYGTHRSHAPETAETRASGIHPMRRASRLSCRPTIAHRPKPAGRWNLPEYHPGRPGWSTDVACGHGPQKSRWAL